MRSILGFRRSSAWLVGAVALALVAPIGTARSAEDPWPGIRKEVFGTRDIVEESGKVLLEAPVRAEDAALVPITVRLPAD